MQLQAGKYFLHERPQSDTNWSEKCIVNMMKMQGVEQVTGHMCKWRMMSVDEQGVGLVKKPTSFMTNSPNIAQ